MKGGLLQLVANKVNNDITTTNPTISFFKNTYNRHTHFSIDNNIRFIGKFKVNNTILYEFKKEGDLLGNINFNIYIPKIILKEIKKNAEKKIIIDTTIDNIEYNYHNNTYYFFIHNNNLYLIPSNILINNYKNINSKFNINTDNNIAIIDNIINSYNNITNIVVPSYNNIYNELLLLTNLYESNTKFNSNFYLTLRNILNNYYNIVDNYYNINYNYNTNINLNYIDYIENYEIKNLLMINNNLDVPNNSDIYNNYIYHNSKEKLLDTLSYNYLYLLSLFMNLYPSMNNTYHFCLKYKYNIILKTIDNSVDYDDYTDIKQWLQNKDTFINSLTNNNMDIFIKNNFEKEYFNLEKQLQINFSNIDITTKKDLFAILETYRTLLTNTNVSTGCENFDKYPTTTVFTNNISTDIKSNYLYFDNKIKQNIILFDEMTPTTSNKMIDNMGNLSYIYIYLVNLFFSEIEENNIMDYMNYYKYDLVNSTEIPKFLPSVNVNFNINIQKLSPFIFFRNMIMSYIKFRNIRITDKTNTDTDTLLNFYFSFDNRHPLTINFIKNKLTELLNVEHYLIYDTNNYNSFDFTNPTNIPSFINCNFNKKITATIITKTSIENKYKYVFDINNLTYVDNIKCKLLYKNNYYDVKLNVENNNYSILTSFYIINTIDLELYMDYKLPCIDYKTNTIKYNYNIIEDIDTERIILYNDTINHFINSTTFDIKQPDYNKYTFNNNTIVLANNPNYISNNHKYYLEIVDNSNNTNIQPVTLTYNNGFIINNYTIDYNNIKSITLLCIQNPYYNISLVNVGSNIIVPATDVIYGLILLHVNNNSKNNLISMIKQVISLNSNQIETLNNSNIDNNSLFLTLITEYVKIRFINNTQTIKVVDNNNIEYMTKYYMENNNININIFAQIDETMPITSSYIKIWNNSHFHNMLDFSSSNLSKENMLSDLDYFCMQPAISILNNNMKIIYNVPNISFFDNITINSNKILLLEKLNSNQMMRNDYQRISFGFDMENIKDYTTETKIKNIILDTFDNIINNEYSNITSLLDNISSSYNNLYTDFINSIENYGDTLKLLASKFIDMNKLNNFNQYINNTDNIFAPTIKGTFDNPNSSNIGEIGNTEFTSSNNGVLDIIFFTPWNSYNMNNNISNSSTDLLKYYGEYLLKQYNSLNNNTPLIELSPLNNVNSIIDYDDITTNIKNITNNIDSQNNNYEHNLYFDEKYIINKPTKVNNTSYNKDYKEIKHKKIKYNLFSIKKYKLNQIKNVDFNNHYIIDDEGYVKYYNTLHNKMILNPKIFLLDQQTLTNNTITLLPYKIYYNMIEIKNINTDLNKKFLLIDNIYFYVVSHNNNIIEVVSREYFNFYKITTTDIIIAIDSNSIDFTNLLEDSFKNVTVNSFTLLNGTLEIVNITKHMELSHYIDYVANNELLYVTPDVNKYIVFNHTDYNNITFFYTNSDVNSLYILDNIESINSIIINNNNISFTNNNIDDMYLLNDDIIVDNDIIDMVLLPDGNYYGYSITLKEINPTITNIAVNTNNDNTYITFESNLNFMINDFIKVNNIYFRISSYNNNTYTTQELKLAANINNIESYQLYQYYNDYNVIYNRIVNANVDINLITNTIVGNTIINDNILETRDNIITLYLPNSMIKRTIHIGEANNIGYETDVLTGTNYNLDTNTVINAKQSLLLLQNNDDFVFVNMNTIENVDVKHIKDISINNNNFSIYNPFTFITTLSETNNYDNNFVYRYDYSNDNTNHTINTTVDINNLYNNGKYFVLIPNNITDDIEYNVKINIVLVDINDIEYNKTFYINIYKTNNIANYELFYMNDRVNSVDVLQPIQLNNIINTITAQYNNNTLVYNNNITNSVVATNVVINNINNNMLGYMSEIDVEPYYPLIFNEFYITNNIKGFHLFMNNNRLYHDRKTNDDTIFTCDNNIVTQNIEGIIIRTNNKYYIKCNKYIYESSVLSINNNIIYIVVSYGKVAEFYYIKKVNNILHFDKCMYYGIINMNNYRNIMFNNNNNNRYSKTVHHNGILSLGDWYYDNNTNKFINNDNVNNNINSVVFENKGKTILCDAINYKFITRSDNLTNYDVVVFNNTIFKVIKTYDKLSFIDNDFGLAENVNAYYPNKPFDKIVNKEFKKDIMYTYLDGNLNKDYSNIIECVSNNNVLTFTINLEDIEVSIGDAILLLSNDIEYMIVNISNYTTNTININKTILDGSYRVVFNSKKINSSNYYYNNISIKYDKKISYNSVGNNFNLTVAKYNNIINQFIVKKYDIIGGLYNNSEFINDMNNTYSNMSSRDVIYIVNGYILVNISNNFNITLRNIELNTEYSHFIVEEYKDNTFYYFVKLDPGYIIETDISFENKNSELYFNGLYKINIVDNVIYMKDNIISSENIYYNNNSISLIYKIPVDNNNFVEYIDNSFKIELDINTFTQTNTEKLKIFSDSELKNQLNISFSNNKYIVSSNKLSTFDYVYVVQENLYNINYNYSSKTEYNELKNIINKNNVFVKNRIFTRESGVNKIYNIDNGNQYEIDIKNNYSIARPNLKIIKYDDYDGLYYIELENEIRPIIGTETYNFNLYNNININIDSYFIEKYKYSSIKDLEYDVMLDNIIYGVSNIQKLSTLVNNNIPFYTKKVHISSNNNSFITVEDNNSIFTNIEIKEITDKYDYISNNISNIIEKKTIVDELLTYINDNFHNVYFRENFINFCNNYLVNKNYTWYIENYCLKKQNETETFITINDREKREFYLDRSIVVSNNGGITIERPNNYNIDFDISILRTLLIKHNNIDDIIYGIYQYNNDSNNYINMMKTNVVSNNYINSCNNWEKIHLMSLYNKYLKNLKFNPDFIENYKTNIILNDIKYMYYGKSSYGTGYHYPLYIDNFDNMTELIIDNITFYTDNNTIYASNIPGNYIMYDNNTTTNNTTNNLYNITINLNNSSDKFNINSEYIHNDTKLEIVEIMDKSIQIYYDKPSIDIKNLLVKEKYDIINKELVGELYTITTNNNLNMNNNYGYYNNNIFTKLNLISLNNTNYIISKDDIMNILFIVEYIDVYVYKKDNNTYHFNSVKDLQGTTYINIDNAFYPIILGNKTFDYNTDIDINKIYRLVNIHNIVSITKSELKNYNISLDRNIENEKDNFSLNTALIKDNFILSNSINHISFIDYGNLNVIINNIDDTNIYHTYYLNSTYPEQITSITITNKYYYTIDALDILNNNSTILWTNNNIVYTGTYNNNLIEFTLNNDIPEYTINDNVVIRNTHTVNYTIEDNKIIIDTDVIINFDDEEIESDIGTIVISKEYYIHNTLIDSNNIIDNNIVVDNNINNNDIMLIILYNVKINVDGVNIPPTITPNKYFRRVTINYVNDLLINNYNEGSIKHNMNLYYYNTQENITSNEILIETQDDIYMRNIIYNDNGIVIFNSDIKLVPIRIYMNNMGIVVNNVTLYNINNNIDFSIYEQNNNTSIDVLIDTKDFFNYTGDLFNFILLQGEFSSSNNNFNDNKFNIEKKEIITKTTTTIEKEVDYTDIHFNLFEYIDLYINENKIDTLNPVILKTLYNLHMSDSKKKQFDKLVKLDDMGDHYKFTLPLLFFNHNTPNMYLPIIGLSNSNIMIRAKLNNLYNTDKLFGIEIDNDVILLDEKEKKLFSQKRHEYLIEKFTYYNSVPLNQTLNVSKLNIKGVIKNLYFVVETIKDRKSYYETITKEYDIIYKEYLELKEEYDKYNNNMTSYSNTFEILSDIETYILLDNLPIIASIKKNKYLEDLGVDFCLYYLLKFTDYIDNINTITSYIYKLYLYKRVFHINKDIISKEEVVDMINLKINNTSMFRKVNSNYLTTVTQHNKLKGNSMEGNYFYSFALKPEEKNPSGHLNFNVFDEVVLLLYNNKRILEENAILHIFTKEYKLLKIMGGQMSVMF